MAGGFGWHLNQSNEPGESPCGLKKPLRQTNSIKIFWNTNLPSFEKGMDKPDSIQLGKAWLQFLTLNLPYNFLSLEEIHYTNIDIFEYLQNILSWRNAHLCHHNSECTLSYDRPVWNHSSGTLVIIRMWLCRQNCMFGIGGKMLEKKNSDYKKHYFLKVSMQEINSSS